MNMKKRLALRLCETRCVCALADAEPGGICDNMADAVLDELRKPDPPDAEVWSCAICDAIVDRQSMQAAIDKAREG